MKKAALQRGFFMARQNELIEFNCDGLSAVVRIAHMQIAA